MAQMTVELRDLLKTNFELFDFVYKFDDKEFKKELEQAVIDFYYFYEINGTPDRFKHYFKRRWLSLASHYNELHNTTLLKYDILTNYSMSEVMDQLAVNSHESNSTSDSTGKTHLFSDSISKNSDYPQQTIAGGDYLADESNTIVDNESSDNSKTTGKTTTQGENNTNYKKTIEGVTGTSYPELIAKHRDSLIRIKQMVIEELKPCFILVH